LGVYCELPLDYTTVFDFAQTARAPELLQILDRAEEFGARYDIDQGVAIVREKIPGDHQLKSTSCSTSRSPSPQSQAPPSLVVLGAKQPHDALFLAEAIRRRGQMNFFARSDAPHNRKQ
jgi:hypothetical protein